MAPRTRDCYQSPKKRSLHALLTPVTHVQPKSHEPFRQGDILCDVAQNKWKIGRCIGVGAFGDVYLASDDLSKAVTNEAQYVVKVEPHSHGPLFVEMNFYLRAAKLQTIDEWKSSHKGLKQLGVPTLLGFGSHVHKSDKYRFIVLPRFGQTVSQMFLQSNKRFHVKTAFTLASHLLDILEFIHSQGYIHLDIKGANMLLGSGANSAPLYLVDYGLATKYVDLLGNHKEFQPDRRKAEAGTMEYISRDAHLGAMARRSDLESLGYNLVHWLTGSLPWLNSSLPAQDISLEKNEAMSNINKFLSSTFNHSQPPPVLSEFLEYVDRLSFKQEPDYDYCRRLFSQAIRDSGFLDDGVISIDSHAKLTTKSKKRKGGERENERKIKKPKLQKRLDTPSRRPFRTVVHNASPVTARVTRNKVDCGKKLRSAGKDFDWAKVLAGDPEKDIKQNLEKRNKKEKHVRIQEPNNNTIIAMSEKKIPKFWEDSLRNPTPAMLKILKSKNSRRQSERRTRSDSVSTPSYYTPAMEEVLAKRQPKPKKYSPKALRSSSRKAMKKSIDAIFACGKF